jgi:ribosome biogenesis GTPase
LLKTYGWSDALQHEFTPFADAGLVPGRVILQQRGLYGVATASGDLTARISGRLAREAPPGGYPTAGDWVAVSPNEAGGATVHHVLSRRTAFVRTASGPGGGVQVVAANVDVAFLTASLNADLNPRRLERYLAAARQSGAAPVVLLTKSDLCADVAGVVARIEALSGDASVHALSSLTGEGLETLDAYLTPGRTAVLVGSSGAGKSTLVNALLGVERMATAAIRETDARGRHTTSHRELILLPGGGLLLDTPGMREMGLWDSDEGLAATFADVESLAAGCRFNNCGHTTEPGCAVRAAVEAGMLDEARWRGFEKLRRELAYQESREDPALRAAERRKWVQITKAGRALYKRRGRE